MGFTQKAQYYLVHHLHCSNKEARRLIAEGAVQVNGKVIAENTGIGEADVIAVDGCVIKQAKKFIYIKFHKPRGFESTLHQAVPGNLSGFFDPLLKLSIAGRLDKESEGLLLLSNDGKWVENICRPASRKEKEYLVKLDREPDEAFFLAFTQGLLLDGKPTLPCICEPTAGTGIRVVLTEGRYRQIRRMCHKLGYGISTLKRIRIDHFCLDELVPGETRLI